jgi:preprotein translocase subunit YajC
VTPVSKGRRTRKPTKDSDVDLFLPLLLLIVLGGFMFMAQRRQKKAMQATIDLHDSLTIGDRIHTSSGLEGTIVGIADDSVDLEIAPGVVTTWMKVAVRDRIGPDDEDDDDYDDDDDEQGEDHYEVESGARDEADPTPGPKTDS